VAWRRQALTDPVESAGKTFGIIFDKTRQALAGVPRIS
jgi:hypothetical protein